MENLEPKVFFEAYLDGHGARHVLARFVSSSRRYAELVDESVTVSPTFANKIGPVKEYVWMDAASLALAKALGTKGVAKYESAIDGQRGPRHPTVAIDSVSGDTVPLERDACTPQRTIYGR